MECCIQYEFFRAQVEIQRQWLKNMYHEVHDNIGQALFAAKLQLECPDKIESHEKKDFKSKDIITTAIRDLRDMVRDVDTFNSKDIDLIKLVRKEIADIQRKKIEVEFSITGETTKMDERRELIIFRLFQQIMDLFMEGGHVTKIKLALSYTENFLEIITVVNKQEKKSGSGDAGPLLSDELRQRLLFLQGCSSSKQIDEQSESVKLIVPFDKKRD